MRKSQAALQTKVGMFVTLGIALFMAVVFFLGSEKNLFDKQYTLLARFEGISGIRVGAPVELAGIKVGIVNKIYFDDSNPSKRVKLLLKVNQKFQDKIREDSIATIVSQGLLGDKMIFISLGSTDMESLTDGQEIDTKEGGGIAKMMEQSGELIANVTELTGNLNEIVAEIKTGKGLAHDLIYGEDAAELIDDLKGFTELLSGAMYQVERILVKVNTGQGTLGAIINDGTLFNDIKTLLGKANRNKLIRAVVRYTMQTKEEKLLKK